MEIDKRIQLVMSSSNMAWWQMELPSGVVVFSPQKTDMIGRQAKDFVHYTDFTKIVHPDDFEAMMKSMQNHLEGKASEYETTYRIKHRNGNYRTFFDRGKIVEQKGEELVLVGIVLDVTDSKHFVHHP